MYLTRKDLLDYIETRNQLDDLAANASAFAQAFTSYVSGVADNLAAYCYETAKLMYIMYHENTKLCLSVYSYNDTELLKGYVKGVMY